jgi:putative spermidine/putrescine transport system permease protein
MLMHSSETARRWINWALLVTVPLLVFGAFYAAPILNLVRLSFGTAGAQPGMVEGFDLHLYADLVSDAFFLEVVWRTVRLSLLTTLTCALVGYPVAFYVAQTKGWEQTILFIILLLPLMTSATVNSYGWLILMSNTGVVNAVLQALGLTDGPIRLMRTETAIVIGLAHVLIVFMIISIAAALQAIDPNHIRAARSLGATPWAAFLRIVLPQSLPGIRTGCLLVFSLSMSAYATPVVLGGARLKFVSFLIYQQAVHLLDWPRAAAMAVLLLIATTGSLALVSAWGLRPRALRRRSPASNGPETRPMTRAGVV